MAKVLLIQPHQDREQNNALEDPPTPLSLVYIGTAIEDYHQVKIYDRNVIFDDADLLKNIKEYDPDIIGLTSFTSKILLDLIYITQLIKKDFPKKIIIVGGIHATIEPKSFLQEKSIDYVLRGEGEESFLEFCDTYDKDQKKLKDLKNINLNPLRNYIDMNKMKLPNYSLLDLKKYKRIYVIISRGCSHNCNFCYSCRMWGKGETQFLRTYSTEKSKELFRELIEKYKFKTLSIVDDNFVKFKSRTVELCKFLEKYKVNLFCYARSDCLDDEVMVALKRAGCHTIFIGAESGSQRMLTLLNKEANVEQNANAIRLCKKYNITADASFMMGITDETIEDLNKTKEFVKRTRPDVANMLIFNPFPGTRTYDYCVEKKLITPPKNLKEWAYWMGDMSGIKHNTSKISDDMIMKIYQETIMIGFYRVRIKKFIYWIKAGEYSYAIRRVKRLFFRNGKFRIPGITSFSH